LRLALAVAILALVAGCGGAGGHSAIGVRISVTTFTGNKQHTSSFTLGCAPTSGTLPFAARVCGDIARHPGAMLNPLPARTTCAGGPTMPQLTVTTSRDGEKASFGGSPNCGWPGGTALAVYFLAAQRDAQGLDRSEHLLRCDDDPTLLARPTPWASVVACVRGLWTPRTERLIRLAERVPAIAALGASLFPTEIGARRCTIPAGGPYPGKLLHGLCGVTVKHVWSAPTVTFVETWPRTATTHARAILQVTITNGHARLSARRGVAPPQLWA
jgi:hypothetical protein